MCMSLFKFIDIVYIFCAHVMLQYTVTYVSKRLLYMLYVDPLSNLWTPSWEKKNSPRWPASSAPQCARGWGPSSSPPSCGILLEPGRKNQPKKTNKKKKRTRQRMLNHMKF